MVKKMEIKNFASIALISVITTTSFASASTSDAKQYQMDGPAKWVDIQPLPALTETQRARGGDTAYMLLDRQIYIEGTSSLYNRVVVSLLNQSGVSENSHINVRFDPNVDTLHMHQVTLHRGNEVIDQMQAGRVEVLRQENELQNNLINGELTLNIIMKDVRVGDVLDYSYTIDHRNPELGNRFFKWFTTSWDDPVGLSRLRVIYPDTVPLFVNSHDDLKPATKTSNGQTTMEWTWNSLPGTLTDPDTPSWIQQHSSIEFSQFANWKELVQVMLPLYEVKDKASPELSIVASKIRAATNSRAEQALAVIKFVQEEIRYTGLEFGEGAFKPTQPTDVLQRRYGDCKDKALLASTLLNNLGIDAAPALVSTTWRHQLKSRSPSPGSFDHVILRMKLDGKIYWIDVTKTGQGGTLDTLVQSNLGAGLVIAQGQSAPEAIPEAKSDVPLVVSNVDFDLTKGIEHNATVTVTTSYHSSEADWVRAKMRTTTVEELSRQYLDYYKRRYASIESTQAIQLKDDVSTNEYIVIEHYKLATPFEVDNKDSSLRQFEVVADAVNDRLRTSESRVRSHPLRLDFPTNVQQSIVVHMPDQWDIEEYAKNIDSKVFHFDSHVTRKGNDVNLTYSYRVKTDQVRVEELTEYFTQRENARLDTYYTFSHRKLKPVKDKAINQALDKLKKASELEKNKSYAEAKQLLVDIEKSPGYPGLSEKQQQYHMYLTGRVAYFLDEDKRAHDCFVKSTSMEGADEIDWRMRNLSAMIIKDYADAALALTTLAERYPDSLKQLGDERIWRTVDKCPEVGVLQYKMLKALFAASYKPAEDWDFSSMWRDLALLQLERFETDAAVHSLKALTDPDVITSVLADNRFANAAAKIVPALDIDAATEHHLDVLKNNAKQNPNKAGPIVDLAYALLDAGKYDEALKTIDAAIAKEADSNGKHYYTDYDKKFVWLLDNRRQALMDLGRWDEALAQQIQATHFEGDSVSQIINLASTYNDLGRPQDALKALAALNAEHASAYGKMQIAKEKLEAAIQMGNNAEALSQLNYMREHIDDSRGTYQQALIAMNKLDEAAELLISRLTDTDKRIGALLAVQDGLDYRRTTWQAKLHERWRTLKSRKDVQDAISRVGKIIK